MMSMYSLYRAWLLRENSSIASPSMSLPPDLILNIVTSPSYHQFVAHRSIVSNHSAYIKSCIQNQEETPGSYTPGVLQVTLPSTINIDTFSPLLTFMYTGYLDLNLGNIYDILLACNVLHMPHALDLCRSFMLHNVHSVANLTFNRANLVKPIPGRPLPQLFGDKTNPEPPPTQDTKAKVVQPEESVSPAQEVPAPPQPPHRPAGGRKSKMKSVRRRRKPKLIRVDSPIESDSSDDVTVVTTEIKRRSTSGGRVSNTELPLETCSAVLDIASCDGPVQFHKVLNENYVYNTSPVEDKLKNAEAGRDQDDADDLHSNSDVEINIDENSTEAEENEENIQRNLVTEQSFQANFRNQIQKQNQGSNEPGDELPSADSSSHLKCNVCSAEFKTPTLCERHKLVYHQIPGGGANTNTHTRPNQRRVIPKTILKPLSNATSRLLDMNVQYYPCKTCGAKFPSYYFVHKHRRRCHPEEELVVSSTTSASGPGGNNVSPPGETSNRATEP